MHSGPRIWNSLPNNLNIAPYKYSYLLTYLLTYLPSEIFTHLQNQLNHPY